jgi:hypothetical protein
MLTVSRSADSFNVKFTVVPVIWTFDAYGLAEAVEHSPPASTATAPTTAPRTRAAARRRESFICM